MMSREDLIHEFRTRSPKAWDTLLQAILIKADVETGLGFGHRRDFDINEGLLIILFHDNPSSNYVGNVQKFHIYVTADRKLKAHGGAGITTFSIDTIQQYGYQTFDDCSETIVYLSASDLTELEDDMKKRQQAACLATNLLSDLHPLVKSYIL